MKVSDYLVDILVRYGVTDVFGIPGGVVLEFLYSIEKKSPSINPRLSFHEQGATFSAAGYAQVSGKLGVAYATRGPGITNTITAVADAFYDSIPLLIITAHSYNGVKTNRRIDENQELNTEMIFSKITKYFARVETIEEALIEIEKACYIATSDRKGPVVLDFNRALFQEEFNYKETNNFLKSIDNKEIDVLRIINDAIKNSNRPIILIGDGIHQSNSEYEILNLVNKLQIPVLSSRYSQDVMPHSDLFFGYIGSHGLRYSNFILDKADLIIVFGNLLSFPVTSKTFRKILDNKRIIRFEIDEEEFKRDIPSVESYNCDIKNVFSILLENELNIVNNIEWISVCKKLKNELNNYDVIEPVYDISKILKGLPSKSTIVSDVGNNEFWLCRAYAFSNVNHRVIYSKSFGAMGCSIPIAIGVYYKTKLPVISFNGDQGIQMNIQELQFISENKLPIIIVILNNSSSGMIKTRQIKGFNSKFLHTTLDSGYSLPSFEKIAYGYNIKFSHYSDIEDFEKFFLNIKEPYIIELSINPEFDLEPSIKAGDDCQNMFPYLDNEIYNELNKL